MSENVWGERPASEIGEVIDGGTLAHRLTVAVERLAAEEKKRVYLFEKSVAIQESGHQEYMASQELLRSELKRPTADPVPPRDLVLTEIREERIRQVEQEGWEERHDDSHVEGELADAAAFYAASFNPEGLWPWPDSDDDDTSGIAKKQNKNRRRQLVIAGALIVAEIERLDRIEERLKDGVCPFEDVPEIPCNDTCPERGRCKVGEREP